MSHAHRVVALVLAVAAMQAQAGYRPLGSDENLQQLDALCARLADDAREDALPGFSPARTRIERLNCAAWALVKAGDSVGAVDALEALAAAGEYEIEDVDAAVRGLDSAGAMLQRIGEPSRAAEVHALALERANDAGMDSHRIGPLVNHAILLSRLGDEARASEHAAEALVLMDATGHRQSEPRLRHLLGSLALRRGDAAGAAAEFAHGLRLAQEDDNPNVAAFLMMGLASAHRAQGEHVIARDLLQEGLAQVDPEVDRDAAVRLRLALAEIHAVLGEHEAALRLAESAAALADDGALGHSLLQAHRVLAEVHERAGRTEAALASLKRFSELNTRFLGEQNLERIGRLEAMRHNQMDRQRIEYLEQANRVQALELERAQTRRSITLGVTAALVAGGLLVIWLQQRMNRRLRVISATDTLTGLRNRYYLRRRMDQARQSLEPSDPRRRSVALLLDVDHFKQVNDTYGHDVGDRALCEVAERLQRLCRAEDDLARWGGEEFLLIARDLGFEDACALARRLVAAIAERPMQLQDGTTVPLAISVGLAPYPFFEDRAQAAWEPSIKLADAALYGIKRAGRNGWVALWGERSGDAGLAEVAADPSAAIAAGAVRQAGSRPPRWQAAGSPADQPA